MIATSLRVETSVARLGPEWDALFAAGAGPQTSRAWFAATERAAVRTGSQPTYLAASDADGPVAMFALLQNASGGMQSLTTPYTCLWQPLLRPGASAAAVTAAARAVGRHVRGSPVTTLEALDPDWHGLAHVLAGLRRAGLACRDYDHFTNWHAPIAGGWEAYLQGRPGALRETIRRKTRAVERDPSIRIEFAEAPEDVAKALAAYEAVYTRSWKDPEPFPDFNSAATQGLAATGRLRMFVMWNADRPLAAQYWTVENKTATVLKLAHDEQEKRLSPGTVLTAIAIRRLIERDAISELDFGRGDDPYKRGWAGLRRARIGVLAINRWTAAGAKAVIRHDVGRALRVWRSHRASKQDDVNLSAVE